MRFYEQIPQGVMAKVPKTYPVEDPPGVQTDLGNHDIYQTDSANNRGTSKVQCLTNNKAKKV